MAFVVRGLLFDGRCLLSVACDVLRVRVMFSCCLQLVVWCLLRAVRCSFFAVCCYLLLDLRCLLFVGCVLLCVVYCPLFTTRCLTCVACCLERCVRCSWFVSWLNVLPCLLFDVC